MEAVNSLEEEKTIEATPYDLKQQDRIIRGRLPTLEIIHDRLCRMNRLTMSGALREIIDIRVRKTELVKFGSFIDGISAPSSINLFGMRPLTGTCLLVFERSHVYTLLDLFYGSPDGLKTEIEDRDFTAIEHELMRRVVISFLADFELAWRPFFPLKLFYHRSEINPQFVAVVAKSEVVLKVTLDFIWTAKNESYPITMCIPYSVIEPLRPLLETGFEGDKPDERTSWKNRLTRNFNEAGLTLVAKTSGKSISARDLINLKAGDILLSDKKPDQPIDIFINDRKKMSGLLRENRGRQTVQVKEIVESQMYDEIENLKKQALKLKGEL